ncbi:DUF4376 domain-containing protein [Azospirillum sp. Sh1]|uniref:DUF4376 domain-containing protein n=1 Tax=Azospirillum sp. Sh1 TaxID=2607285 RepID=UPI0011EEB366|nr:DUF4376 domain-containing protein [Azospirillum sp. Sh1]KAA0573372.1 DUF4376 domain-containing protein [Azospirillum sp. Sh1]
MFPVALVLDGEILSVFSGPMPFVGPDGVQHSVTVWTSWTDKDWEEKCPGVQRLPVIDNVPTSAAATARCLPTTQWKVTDTAVETVYETFEKSLDTVKTEHKNLASSQRYVAETGGITVGGAVIRTDRESQGLVNGAYSLARDMVDGHVPAQPIDFKGASGWEQIAPEDMVAIGRAVALHVQACFSRERALHRQIDDAGDIEAVLAINVTAGWPSA